MSYVHWPRHQPDTHSPMWQTLKLYLGTVHPLGTRLWPESGIKPADLSQGTTRSEYGNDESDRSFVWMWVDALMLDYVGPGILGPCSCDCGCDLNESDAQILLRLGVSLTSAILGPLA
jgi:hypothetical protein